MIIRNSVKQLLRTPLKTIAMFLLIAVSTALFILGVVLFWWNQKDIAEFEDSFTTIGTVEQMPEQVKTTGIWDAEMDDYRYYSRKEYGDWIKDSVLDFEGADYIIKPQKRPYFVAMISGKAEKVWELYAGHSTLNVVEVVPKETHTIDPILVHVSNVLSGEMEIQDTDIYLCDHSNKTPDTLEEGKTYIMVINGPGPGHDQSVETGESGIQSEYWPVTTDSTQYTIDDVNIGKDAGSILFDEVKDGFYETERGKVWKYLIDLNLNEYLWDAIPVRPVESTDQLMAFHNKNASIEDGTDISEEEYKSGKDVCLISKQYAKLMNLKVGDRISLPLQYALYRVAPSQEFGGSPRMSPLNAEFEPYQVFDNDEYTIVGIYGMEVPDDSAFGLSEYEVIVPYKSVTGDWSNNIVSDGPMTMGTTTFQIPNGSVDAFEKAWKAQGIDGLKITFYDGGYSDFQNAIKDRKMMSYILLLGGGIATLVILALFGHLQIIKQRNRIFIERALGMSKKKCRRSILSGMYLIMACGVAAGGAASFIMTDSVMNRVKNVQLFDTTFSNGASETVAFASQMSMLQKGMCVGVGCLIVVVCALIIHNLYVNQVLQGEPVELMEKEE